MNCTPPSDEKNCAITVDMLKGIFPAADEDDLKALVDELNGNLKKYKLDSPLRLSHFFSQVVQETGEDFSLVESLNYTPIALISSFDYFAAHPEEAEKYGRTSEHPANPEAIANRAYGNRYENGSVSSGDGWKYRGRGILQMTFKYNYRMFNEDYATMWGGEDADFVQNPELLAEPKYAARSAIHFWITHGLHSIADGGSNGETVNSITRVINKNTDSYAERRFNFRDIWGGKVFNSVNC